MKKRLLFVAAGLACVLIAGYFVHAWRTKTRINRETFKQIEKGMTLAEVEQISRARPGHYETRQRRIGVLQADVFAWDLFEAKHTLTWSSNDGEITVVLDKDGRVADKAFQDVELESLQDTFWRWLGFAPEPTLVLID